MSWLARTSGLDEWLIVKEIEICGRGEHFMLTVHFMWLVTLLVWRVGFWLAASTCCEYTLPSVECVNVCCVCVLFCFSVLHPICVSGTAPGR